MQIAEKQDEELKKQWGIFSYVVAAVGTLNEARALRGDGLLRRAVGAVRAYQIAVGNGIHFGGGLTVSPEAEIDDGLLDVYAIETASVPELIALAPRLRDGTLVERDDVAFFRGPTALVETREADAGQHRRRGDDRDARRVLGAQRRARGVRAKCRGRWWIDATFDAGACLRRLSGSCPRVRPARRPRRAS